MCSAPRYSAKPYNYRRISLATSSHCSYSQMFRSAVQYNKQRRKEITAKRAALVQRERDGDFKQENSLPEVKLLLAENRQKHIAQNVSILKSETKVGFFMKKTSQIYHEYQ